MPDSTMGSTPSFFLLLLIVGGAFAAGLILRSLFTRAPGAMLWLATIVLALGGMLAIWGLFALPARIMQHQDWAPLPVQSVSAQEQWSMWAFRPMMISWLAILGIGIVGAALWSKRPKAKFGPGTSLALMGLVAVSLLFFMRFGVSVNRSSNSRLQASSHFANSYPTPVPRNWQPTMAPSPFDHVAPTTRDIMSIDDMWAQMTAPRIKLDGVSLSTTLSDETASEVTDAAKVILSASLPGADPFTQGWLVNAAKAILRSPASASPTVEDPAIDPFAETPSRPQSAPHSTINLSDPDAITRSALPKPDWVVNPPKQVGNVRKMVVVSDPYVTADEGRNEVDDKMKQIVVQRIRSQSGLFAQRSSLSTFEQLGLGSDYVRRELCTDEYVEPVYSSVGEMKRVYALLEFNEAQDQLLVDRAKYYFRRDGLKSVALLAMGMLGIVATLFGLLKADTWTRGYYTKRLFLGVPAAIITVLTLLFVS